jgi:hypothetical protein
MTLDLWIFLSVVALTVGVIVLYALYCKGDVFAELSHGPTSFKLQAKERPKQKKLE